MQSIIVEVGQTKIQTQNASLARMVLESATGLTPPVMAELGCVSLLDAFTPPAIGQFWPGQGGFYAGLVRGESSLPDYHLVVPSAEHGEVKEITWGSAGQKEDNSENEWGGAANTACLTASEHSHPAAEWAAGLSIDGHSDFYLPSRRELRLCWVNLPEQFAKEWYWSSTQCSPGYAWVQLFVDGFQDNAHKYSEFRARAVRRVVTR